MENIYTLDEIRELITPVAQKHNLAAVWVFGSYARGEATETSDVDLLIDDKESSNKGIFALSGLHLNLEEQINKPIDLITLDGLNNNRTQITAPYLRPSVLKERRLIYERKRHRIFK
jgi:predicted nucleotidyltransferase